MKEEKLDDPMIIGFCKKCDMFGTVNGSDCYSCKQKEIENRGFLRYLWDEVTTYRLACFCSASIINGIFMHHFKYDAWEIIIQAIFLGILLPGIFKNV